MHPYRPRLFLLPRQAHRPPAADRPALDVTKRAPGPGNAALKKVLEGLARDPAYGPSRLERGRFHCFTKKNWTFGIRFLARGADPVLKAPEELEGSIPARLEERLPLA
jgi:hypothetical protein